MPASDFEFPGLGDALAPVWRSAHGEIVQAADGRELVDVAYLFGAAIHGHGALLADDTPAPLETLPTGLGDLQTSELRAQACEALCALAAREMGLDRSSRLRAVVLQSGSEAVETALKTAFRATGRQRVVAFQGAYHGTFGLALAVTHGARFREPFAAQFASTVRWHPFGEVPQLSERDACVIVEPVLGRAGVVLPPDGYLAELRAACDDTGTLLVVDAVLVGCGRTGVPLEGAACAPDLLCLGKALGGGVPASAVVARAEVAQRAWGDVQGEAIHTATNVGHPLSCMAALRCIARLDAPEFGHACERWQHATSRIADETALAVRGKGLLWAVDTGVAGGGLRLSRALLEAGMIAVPSAADASCVTLTPATCSSEATAERLVAALVASAPSR